MKITPFFRWFDIWIGAYWDRDARALYICPFPMLGLKIEWPKRPILTGERLTWLETDEEVTVECIDEDGRVWVRFDDSDQRGWIDARELRHVA